MATATEERTEVSVLPWGIEADHPRNSDLVLQCLPGARLRSTIDGSKPAIDAKTGIPSVPLSQSKGLANYPKTPGMQIHVNPKELTWTIVDPLHGNREMCERLKNFIKQTKGFTPSDRFDGIPPQSGKIDVHQMKSLCREMLWLVEANEAKKVKGPLPSMNDIEGLPGYFLLNPGSRVQNSQPRYEKDLAAWVDRLSAGGG